MSELETFLQRRRKARARFERADATIAGWDEHARDDAQREGHTVPPMEASPADLELSSTAQITVSAEWLAYMLAYAQDVGVQIGERDPEPAYPAN